MTLVSVVVTSYNSAPFIEETLESVYAQTYRDIELIVSDDGSSDDSVQVASRWLAGHGQRFVRTDLITVPANTGVSANCNRSIAASRGAWIKFIAGDDILLPGCIHDNMEFVRSNPSVNIVFSYVRLYRNEFLEGNFLGNLPASYPWNIMDPSFSASTQHDLLLLSDRIRFTPSYFFRKQALVEVGGYDESNRQVEDYPMWLKLTAAGYRLDFLEKETVGYRQHDRAQNNVASATIVSPSLLKVYPFRSRVVLPQLPWDLRYSERWVMTINRMFWHAGWNRKTALTMAAHRLATVYLNPFHYVLWVRRRVLGAGKHDVRYSG